MTLMQAVKAYKAAEKLSYQTGLKRKTSIHVFLLREALKPAFVYNSDEEEKIINAYPNFDPYTGTVKIEGDNVMAASRERQQIQKEFEDLHNSEWDQNQFVNLPQKFAIEEDENIDKLTPDDLGSLMAFVEFE